MKKLLNGMENAKVLGYVKTLPKILSDTDVFITKPGGLSYSEALAKQVPMILTTPIPGQEMRNTSFLVKHKVALLSKKPQDIPRLVQLLLEKPNRVNSSSLSKPLSALAGAKAIIKLNRRAN